MRALFLILVVLTLSFGSDLQKVRDFFSREGYVVDVMEGKVFLDLGKGRVFVGERFEARWGGKEITHPVTGEVLGTVGGKRAILEVAKVEDRFSVAEVVEGDIPERGVKVKLVADRVCFQGSEETRFKLGSVVGEFAKEDCLYKIVELEEGIGIEFKGRAVAFFPIEKPRKVVITAPERKGLPQEIRAKSDLVASFTFLPLSADLCNLRGEGKNQLVVLSEDFLILYELSNGKTEEITRLRTPAGYPLWVQCADLEGKGRDLVILNFVSGESGQSNVYSFLAGELVPRIEKYPYFLKALDPERPGETLIAQSFDSRDLWGDAFKVKIEGDQLEELEKVSFPQGFRLDSAVQMGNVLIFSDEDGVLRVLKEGKEIFAQENFGGSYITAGFSDLYEDEDAYVFWPRFARLKVGDSYFGVVAKNVTSPVHKFLGVIKFSEGKVFLVDVSSESVKLREVRGVVLKEAIQALIEGDKGEIYALTAVKGTLSSSGELVKLKLEGF